MSIKLPLGGDLAEKYSDTLLLAPLLCNVKVHEIRRGAVIGNVKHEAARITYTANHVEHHEYRLQGPQPGILRASITPRECVQGSNAAISMTAASAEADRRQPGHPRVRRRGHFRHRLHNFYDCGIPYWVLLVQVARYLTSQCIGGDLAPNLGIRLSYYVQGGYYAVTLAFITEGYPAMAFWHDALTVRYIMPYPAGSHWTVLHRQPWTRHDLEGLAGEHDLSRHGDQSPKKRSGVEVIDDGQLNARRRRTNPTVVMTGVGSILRCARLLFAASRPSAQAFPRARSSVGPSG